MPKRTTILLTLLASLLLCPGRVLAQNVVEVTDGDLTGDVVWTSDNTYVLVGRVFVEDGASLTIEPGTVVKGRFNADPNNAAALVVAQGGKIYAEGTPEQPVIFTAEDDDVADPTDLAADDRALWGGVILLGRARTNTAGGTGQIEGIPESDTRGTYGGNDDEDDSGVFRYVSIRHGGARIAPDNEINGLTMGAVGRGTTIEYVEVFANQDDGFEWFGGTVDTKYLVAAFCGDDAFDYDEGFRGRGQFWFAVQADDDAGSGGEFDGGTTPEDGQPYAIPVVYNLTMIGSGAGSDRSSNDFAMNIRDNAGGKFYNSIFTDFFGRAVQVEDLASGEDSWARLQAGELAIENNLFWGFGQGSTPADLFVVGGQPATSPQFVAYVTDAARNNRIEDPMLAGVSRTPDAGLDPRPAAGSPALSGAVAPPADGFFTQVDYLGAFGADLWLRGWTALDEAGFVGDISTVDVEQAPGEIPAAVALAQNYPNPFNPATNIEFRLDRAQPVRLAVYDLMGREVAVLVDGVQAAGAYRVAFDASKLASGTYVYQLRTQSATVTRAMMLAK